MSWTTWANAKRYPSGRTVTRVMPSFTRLDLMVLLGLREASFGLGRTCAVTSTTSGFDQIRDSPREALDRPANSMTLSAISVASLLTSVTRHVKSSACRRLQRSLLWFRANISWAIPEKQQFGQGLPAYGLQTFGKPSACSWKTVAWPSTNNSVNAPCDRLESEERMAVLPGPDTVQKHSPAAIRSFETQS